MRIEELEKVAMQDRADLEGVKQGDRAIAAILRILRRQTEMEVSVAIAPNLSDPVRHFNAGRVAGLKDALVMLEESIPR